MCEQFRDAAQELVSQISKRACYKLGHVMERVGVGDSNMLMRADSLLVSVIIYWHHKYICLPPIIAPVFFSFPSLYFHCKSEHKQLGQIICIVYDLQ